LERGKLASISRQDGQDRRNRLGYLPSRALLADVAGSAGLQVQLLFARLPAVVGLVDVNGICCGLINIQVMLSRVFSGGSVVPSLRGDGG